MPTNTPMSTTATRAGTGLCLALTLALGGCGGSDGDDAPPATGRLADGPVSGLDYQRGSAAVQRTDAQGQYTYRAGEPLRFAIGRLALGSATAAATLSVRDIAGGAALDSPAVTNRLVLLQTLDADGDLNNGIQITDAIRAIVSDQAANLDFTQPTDAFRSALVGLMSQLNQAAVFRDLDPRPRSVRSALAAQEVHARAVGPRHTVRTTEGELSGFEASAGTWQFLGVPYARPPVGDLRWRPTQPPTAWTGVRQAVAWGDQAAQNPTFEAIGEGGMSEDSLYLNITAPKNANGLPVMVWLHGGAFAILTGNSRQYNNPDSLPTQGVVLVTVNHRLGPFGYLSHPMLTAESGYGGSGNYGQMDLVQALRWVQANIRAFGGDPGNVTVFGQSGGGGKTYGLMNSPQAAGLFHKAIVQSGANPLVTTTTPASSLAANEAIGTALFGRLGVTTLAQARALTWTQIVQSDLANNIPREIYRPNTDLYHLPKTYYRNAIDGMPSDVPLMVGVTSGDYSSLRASLAPFMAQRTATYQSPQYVYNFSRVPDAWSAMGLLAGHGGELPYLFNSQAGMASNYNLNLVLTASGQKPAIADLNGNGITGTQGDLADISASMGWGQADADMVQTMMTLWTSFARHGEPRLPGFTWPVYSNTADHYAEIGPTGVSVRTQLQSGFR